MLNISSLLPGRSTPRPERPSSSPSQTNKTTSTPGDQVSLSSESKESQSSGGIGQLVGGLLDSFGGQGLGDGPTATKSEQRKADATSAKHGDVSHDLSDKSQVNKLIERSPQIDALGSTDDDAKRCGAASIFNGMLQDGSHLRNGLALGMLAADTAKDSDFQLNDDQQKALGKMMMGNLTPKDAAHLQEATYDMMKVRSGSSEDGVNAKEIGDTVTSLREYGAFGNTKEINFRRGDLGAGAPHWTVSTKTKDGSQHYADSGIGSDGLATAGGADKASFAPFAPSGDDSIFLDSLTLKPNSKDGKDEMLFRFSEDGDFKEQSIVGGEVSDPRTLSGDELY